MHSTHALIFGGKIITRPAADWQATGGKKLFKKQVQFIHMKTSQART